MALRPCPAELELGDEDGVTVTCVREGGHAGLHIGELTLDELSAEHRLRFHATVSWTLEILG